MPANNEEKRRAARQLQVARQQAQIAASMLAAQAARAAEQQAMAERAVRARDASAARSAALQQVVSNTMNQARQIATAVLLMRSANPGVTGINAGVNGSIGITAGGRTNPVQINMGSNAHGLTLGEVLSALETDNSDSGFAKIRIGDVLIHFDSKPK